MSRDYPSPSIAIRWDDPARLVSPDGTTPYLVTHGDTIDAAGEEAARLFAKRLRDEAKRLGEWADGIERALRGACK